MKEEFVVRLNRAMRIRGLKQSELVEKTGLAKSAISQYCSGKVEAKQTALYLLAQALSVTEPWLMGYDVEMEKAKLPNSLDADLLDLAKQHKDMLLSYDELPPDEQAALLTLVNLRKKPLTKVI